MRERRREKGGEGKREGKGEDGTARRGEVPALFTHTHTHTHTVQGGHVPGSFSSCSRSES